MILSTTKMTAQQFLQLGEDPPGLRLELVSGEIAVNPSQTPDHSFSVIQLSIILNSRIHARGLGQLFGDVGVIFGEHDVRRPDLLFFKKSRLHLIGEKAMEGPPDLCVEVLGPSSGQMDRKNKFELYRKGKVAHYWIVDPRQRTIEAYRLKAGKYVGRVRGSGSDIVQLPPFADLEIPLGQLWRPKR